MTQAYIKGFGLVSSLGANLNEALQQLHQPPEPQCRILKGAEHSVPYFAISPSSIIHLLEGSASWYQRCRCLINQAMDEAGVTRRSGTLYLASSSCQIGALETGERCSVDMSCFLGELAEMVDWQGPVYWINTSCTSSLNAVMAARDGIASGLFEEAVVIGFELENKLSLAGFAGMQLLSRDKPKPFAVNRDGLVLGEAVAVLYMSAQQSRWRVAGGAQVIDSDQASGASTTAYQAMLKQTLTQSGWSSLQIGLVKVQAAGSVANDAVEAQALNHFFARVPPLISFKSLLGHTLGASGAAEIALLLAMLERQQWPHLMLDQDVIDGSLGVNFEANAPENIKRILTCNLGFGGSHTCVALEDMHV